MRRRRGSEAYRVAAANIHRGRARARLLSRHPVVRAFDALGWSVARLGRALGCTAFESERLARAFGETVNGLPEGCGAGGGAGASSRQLAGVDVVVWDEADLHKE